MADALRERGKTASARGDTVQGNAIYTEMAELAERISDRWNGAIALNNLGHTASQSGDWERVVELCGRSSALRRELGDEWGMALALCNVAFAELQLGRLSSAASSLGVALDTSMTIDAKTVVIWGLDVSVGLAVARGKMHEAAASPGRLRDCWRSSAQPGTLSREAGSSERSNPFTRPSAPTRRPRSSVGGNCRSTRRRRLRSPQGRPGLTATAPPRGSTCPSRDTRRRRRASCRTRSSRRPRAGTPRQTRGAALRALSARARGLTPGSPVTGACGGKTHDPSVMANAAPSPSSGLR